ncbi:glycosyl transferase [Acidilobus saccharovorans 345-15]|uniref:Glycosyl transferase n=1 Tax=Acidilobus saccharovorans (strain DSM 16705 / JCM 18335 / VKM B-2471 / 345-15) TaxID=666510 RepID=D9Q1L3_ACIS3|nr:glycosyltransferase [Acidilobus saccharovorans]ADL19201.1 glycosyl transferase [Acidilobus saccharovorans 345-15]
MAPLKYLLYFLAWLLSAVTTGIYVYGIIKFRGSYSLLRKLEDGEVRRPVEVVVAARNEERRIGGLMRSLSWQPLREVVLVDDSSSDGTVRKAEEELKGVSLKVIRADGPPPGWLPKPHALELGASRVSLSSSMLFLDADVRGDLHDVIVTASTVRPGELVAFEPRFVCRTSLCRLTQPLLTSIVHGFFGFDRALNPSDRHSMMFGCCWSIDPYSFWESGGMAQVRDSIVEDRTLAVKLKERGFRLRPYDARGSLLVESWGTARDFVNLIRRVSYAVANVMSLPSYLAFSVGVTILMVWPLVMIPLAALGHPLLALGPAITYAAQAAFTAMGQRLEGIRGPWFLASPLAGALVAYGFVSARFRPISWKGRSLRPSVTGT